MTVLIGNLIKVRATFKDDTQVKMDPTVVTLHVKNPADTETSYVYGTDPEVVRESQGVYYMLLDTTAQPGEWMFVWNSTGTLQAAGQTKFTVADTYF